MLTKAEYKRECIRIWDSLRELNKGRSDCAGVDCTKCPFSELCNKPKICNAFELIEIVEKWSKEHPVITMADKFKEVFGENPIKRDLTYVCPHSVGFANFNPECKTLCIDCKNQFWKSEYKEPKKGKEGII